MPPCEVTLFHSRIRKNTFLDNAENEADALRQFHEKFKLPPLPQDGSIDAWPITVHWQGAAPQPRSPAAPSAPKTAAEAIAREVEATAPPAPKLDVLKPFGVNAPMVTALKAAGLESVPAIIAHAKKHKGLVVPGIDAAAAQTIKNAIKAFQSNES